MKKQDHVDQATQSLTKMTATGFIYKWIYIKGQLVLEVNNGQAHYIFPDGLTAHSINGSYFDGDANGIRWTHYRGDSAAKEVFAARDEGIESGLFEAIIENPVETLPAPAPAPEAEPMPLNCFWTVLRTHNLLNVGDGNEYYFFPDEDTAICIEDANYFNNHGVVSDRSKIRWTLDRATDTDKRATEIFAERDKLINDNYQAALMEYVNGGLPPEAPEDAPAPEANEPKQGERCPVHNALYSLSVQPNDPNFYYCGKCRLEALKAERAETPAPATAPAPVWYKEQIAATSAANAKPRQVFTHTVAAYEGRDITTHCGLQKTDLDDYSATLRCKFIDANSPTERIQKITCVECMLEFLAAIKRFDNGKNYGKVKTVFNRKLKQLDPTRDGLKNIASINQNKMANETTNNETTTTGTETVMNNETANTVGATGDDTTATQTTPDAVNNLSTDETNPDFDPFNDDAPEGDEDGSDNVDDGESLLHITDAPATEKTKAPAIVVAATDNAQFSVVISDLINKIKAENSGGTEQRNAHNTSNALEKYARSLKGTENDAMRHALILALADTTPEQVIGKKLTFNALSVGLVAKFMNEDVKAALTAAGIFKTEKVVEPAEPTAEEAAYLATVGQATPVNQKLAALAKEDLQVLASAASAAFFTVIKILARRTNNEFPDSAANFLSYLIAASGGSSEAFTLNDAFVAETSNVSSKTVGRGRESLKKWMSDAGIGICDIVQDGKATTYQLHLLSSITDVLQRTVSGGSNATDNLMIVAALANRLNSTDAKRQLPAAFTEEHRATLRQVERDLLSVVDTLPAPKIIVSVQTKATQAKAAEKRIEEFQQQVSTLYEDADEFAPEVVEKVAAVRTKIEQAEAQRAANPEFIPNFEDLKKDIEDAKSFIDEAKTDEVTKVKQTYQEEIAATGEATEDTLRSMAESEIKQLEISEVADNVESAILEAEQRMFYIVAGLERLGKPIAPEYKNLQASLAVAFRVTSQG